MKSAGKARNNGLYRHIRTSKEIIRNLLNDSKKNKWFFHVSQPANNNIIIYHLIWAGQSLHFQGFRAVSAQMAVVFCPLRSSSSLVFRFGKTEQANGKGRLHSIKHNKEYVTSTVFQLL